VSAAQVSDALARLEGMAAAGSLPDDVAHEAEAIAAGWWWNAQGNLAPDPFLPSGVALISTNVHSACGAPVQLAPVRMHDDVHRESAAAGLADRAHSLPVSCIVHSGTVHVNRAGWLERRRRVLKDSLADQD
jgi:hypothetical protein